MIDLYLKAADQATLDAALESAGLMVEGRIVAGVAIDRIGPFAKVTGYDAAGEPIMQTYPDYHCNLRVAELSEEAEFTLAPLTIAVPETPYRTWA